YWIAGVGMTRTTTAGSRGGSTGTPPPSTKDSPERNTARLMLADSADRVVSASTVSSTYCPSAASRSSTCANVRGGGGPAYGSVLIVYVEGSSDGRRKYCRTITSVTSLSRGIQLPSRGSPPSTSVKLPSGSK